MDNNETIETISNEIIDNGEVDEVTRAAQLEAAKAANKPMIDHLPDAVEKDEMGLLTLLAAPGEKLIIERVASVLSHKPWLDTKTYTIQSIDVASGFVSLWDDDLRRDATTNYIQGLKAGYRFKLVTRKGMQIGAKKRGRPKKNPTVETKPVETDANGQPIKKKRGRPPGVKNKSTIVAEAKAQGAQYE
jgi:hypothetical protein